MIERELHKRLLELALWFPIVAVTGPRQSGKTTLVRAAFPSYTYVNLEDPRLRSEAREDPMGFLENRPKRLIIDEAQHAPEIFSALQLKADESPENGQYVISGSQNFALLQAVKQSLAGRVGMLRLLPFSYAELENTALAAGVTSNAREREAESAPPSPIAHAAPAPGMPPAPSPIATPAPSPINSFMLLGGYPRLRVTRMDPAAFFDSYIETYLERDVAGLLEVRNIASYRKVLKLLAHNAGNLLNYARLASDAGVAVNTVRAWVGMLESSYMIFTLQPYFANIRKRLTKTPKVYFYDVGLLCFLLGIRTIEELVASEYRGAIFENMVIAETLKHHHNLGRRPEAYFYRDDSKREVDLLDFTFARQPRIAEIKASTMYHHRYSRWLNGVAAEIAVPSEARFVILQGGVARKVDGVQVVPAPQWLSREYLG